jgi:ribokinase
MNPVQCGPVVVIGSINMDLVCRTLRRPDAGETVLGSEFLKIHGGKGSNQSVAAARLGSEVYHVGRVGDDDFGKSLIEGLSENNVRTDYVKITKGKNSGCAVIVVDGNGENSIVVVPGANYSLSPDDIDAAEDLIKKAGIVVLQLEIPYETVKRAIDLCKRHGIFTILDPAPAPEKDFPPELFGVDIISPNEKEAAILAGGNFSPGETVALLKEKGSDIIVFKRGEKGALIAGIEDDIISIAPLETEVIDSTAAGDAFTGALAVALTESMPLEEAVRFANIAGALSCRKFGAQPSLPTRDEVEKYFI